MAWLNFGPARVFRGRTGAEQSAMEDKGPIDLRHGVGELRSYNNARGLFMAATAGIIAVIAIVAGLFVSGALSLSGHGGKDSGLAGSSVIVLVAPDAAARLVSPDFGVTIDVAAGTVNAPSQLIYKAVVAGEMPPLSGFFSTTGKVFDLTTSMPLLKPITITVQISPAEVVLAGSLKENIVIQHYSEGQWTRLETEVDLGQFTAAAQVVNLSIFALTVKEPESTRSATAFPKARPATAAPTAVSASASVPEPTQLSEPTEIPTATVIRGPTSGPTSFPTTTAQPTAEPLMAPVATLTPPPTTMPFTTPTPRPTATVDPTTVPVPAAPVPGNLLRTAMVPAGLGTLSVNPSSEDQKYAPGTLVRITVSCENQFEGWAGEVPARANATSRSIVVAMDQATAIIANCASEPLATSTYTLKINGQTPHRGELILFVLNGSVRLTQPPGEGGSLPAGTRIVLMASPTETHFQVNWSGVDSTDGNFATVLMDCEKDVEVSIVQPMFTLTANPNILNGGSVAGGRRYQAGMQATVVATANPGWRFNRWSGDCTGGGGCLVTMDSDKSVIANFEPTGSGESVPTGTPSAGQTPIPTATPTPLAPGVTPTPTSTLVAGGSLELGTPSFTPTPTLPTVLPVGGSWSATGGLGTPRHRFASALLQSGKFLVVGGFDGTGSRTSTAELYDPSAGTWSSTGSMNLVRAEQPTATRLADGKVLVAGGQGNGANDSAEVYDPFPGTFGTLLNMTALRSGHTATLLHNGKVLLAGGSGGEGRDPALAELFDPTTSSFTATANMGVGRGGHTATPLPSGLVLVVGGRADDNSSSLQTAELYNPSTGAWTNTGSMATGRTRHTATLLNNGKVLVVGGINFQGSPLTGTNPVTAEVYDPSTGTWTGTGDMVTTRYFHSATLLANGQVLIAGGTTGVGSTATASIYDPSTGTFATTNPLTTGRYFHGAALLTNGKVLVAAGTTGSTVLGSAVLFSPAP